MNKRLLTMASMFGLLSGQELFSIPKIGGQSRPSRYTPSVNRAFTRGKRHASLRSRANRRKK